MKKTFAIILSSIALFFLWAPFVLAQELPQPDMSVWNSEKLQPVRAAANIIIGVVLGITVLYGVIRTAWYGIRLQSAGGDPIKSQEAKQGLKSTLTGVIISFGAIFVIGIILYVLGIIGLKNS